MIDDSKSQVTQLLFDLSSGNRKAVDMLMPLVYKEMHQLAHMHLRGERRNHTLNATALVHEAYMNQILATFIDDKMKRESKPEELIALDEALKKLEQINERQSKIIEHWFFVGLNHEEIAEILEVSVPTVRRDFRLAKAWLTRELNQEL